MPVRRAMGNRTVGNAGWVAAGALTSGAASATALAVATRSLGAREAAPLAVAWTLAVVVGPGLWSSVELEVARQTASSSATSAATVPGLVVRRAAIAASVVAAAGLALRGRLFSGSVAVPLVLSALAAAYGPLHVAWGRLAGEGRGRDLAASVASEGLLRLALVGGTAIVVRSAAGTAAALAVAVAVDAAGTRAVMGPMPPFAPATPQLAALTCAGLLSQAALLGAPAMFALLAGPSDPRISKLALAVILARAPALAWKAVVATVVPAVATALAAGQQDVPQATARTVLTGAIVVAGFGAVLAAAIGDPVLRLLTGNGDGGGLGAVPLALLACGTVAHLGAVTASAALAGSERGRAAALAWAGGIGVAAAVLVLPGDPLLIVAVALAAGTTTALVASAVALCRAPRIRSIR